ncbi:unnamed protein product [Phytophthora lilii]|uniref:Unnamed protein product n=1 Tax=Phytophthora lilii TaxID=2077276 RepID=A0A9W6TT51_9STRA|nr:unnamed protein product [Phytophthora lilii]
MSMHRVLLVQAGSKLAHQDKFQSRDEPRQRCQPSRATSSSSVISAATSTTDTTPADTPPATASRAETPPATTPPATTPPATTPPATTPPTTTPPATTPPATTPPATTPPATTSPATTAPTTTSPATTSPATTSPATTAPATTAPTPTTAAPAPTTETPTPTTKAPTPPTPTTPTPTTTAPAATTAPATRAPTPTTAAPATAPSTAATPTLAPAATTAAPPVSTTSAATSPPSTSTAAPVVERYNSSTLPPGVSPSMLNGSELVTVEVTETTLGNGSTSYSYVIITTTGETVKAIVLSPTASSVSGDSTTAASSSSDTNNTAKSSGSLGTGAVVGIIVGALVFMLVLFAFFIAQRRRGKQRPSDASSDDILDSPVVGKQVRLLGQGQSMADTEFADVTRTTANSRSSGGSMPEGRRHRGTLWEDPVILASRIPIDRIELGSVIGRGAFGEVYRGRYRDQDVAVKTLLAEKRKDMTHIQAFLSEVRLMATMEHPHIVQFIGVAWESLSDLFCVTEFMAGGDLRTLLKDYLTNNVPQGMDASKMQIAYQVAYALTYLHSLEPVVLHRDLKSRNILLTESLNAKITDFGASRIRSDASMTSNVGSSLWMAPEVMMGRHYDEKADVFSLGVVMSELDTHELPYSHAKEDSSSSGRLLPDTAVLQMVSMGKLRVSFSRYMHPDMIRFVERCVSVDPQARPTAAEVLDSVSRGGRTSESSASSTVPPAFTDCLGMDLKAERDLFWIARDALKASGVFHLYFFMALLTLRELDSDLLLDNRPLFQKTGNRVRRLTRKRSTTLISPLVKALGTTLVIRFVAFVQIQQRK